MQTHHFPVARMARYLTSSPVTSETCDLLVGLHGYGQLAKDLADALAPVSVSGRVLVCPEALSHYYTNHRKRVVGASWMTSEDREYEIMDYVSYLDGLVEEVTTDAPDHMRLTVLGFSQGASTATRWIGNGQVPADRLILWGAPHAHDLTDEEWAVLKALPEIILVFGTEDTVVPAPRMRDAESDLIAHGCTVRTHAYDGGHKILESVLKEIV